MSHVVEIKTQVKDATAVTAACRRLKLHEPRQATVTLFNTEVTGLAVQLPQWTFPIVCDIHTGEVKYDNYGGRWGQQCHLDQFLQAYAVEKARLEARRQGHSVSEQQLEDGSIRVRIAVAG